MASPLDILYVGPIQPGQTCLQRMLMLREMGHRVVGFEPYPLRDYTVRSSLARRIRRRAFGPRDETDVNGRILGHIRQAPVDVLWLDKGIVIERATLRRVRQMRPDCVIAGYSPDDMMHRNCSSRQFRAHLPCYDIYFTTKSFGVAELQGAGARRVVFVENGYDPATHAPVPVTPEDRARLGGPVGFIGDFEAERATSMTHLADAGIGVRIWGPNWHKLRRRPPLLQVEGRAVMGRDYGHAICAFDINLGFLRKYARDLQTQRSVEIPACGAFMLAERTSEHLGLFEEGKEAEFFASDEELLRKVRHYLEHPDERKRIALAGRERCITGRYSNHDRLARCIELVREIQDQLRSAAGRGHVDSGAHDDDDHKVRVSTT